MRWCRSRTATLTVSQPVPYRRRDEGRAAERRKIGQHSEEVLREAGYSADDIGRLRTLGVLA